MVIDKVKLEGIDIMKLDNITELKNTINSILKQENWIEFVETATCNYRSGRFYNLNNYNCYEWYNEIKEEVGYDISMKPLYEYIKDKAASEQLKLAYEKASESENWDEYINEEVEILSGLDADKLEMTIDWEIIHIREIEEYLNEDETQVIIARAHCSHNWKKSYLVYDINKEEIEEVLK